MLGKILRDAFSRNRDQQSTQPRRRVLNVGGSSKAIPIPAYFDGWEHLLLDIDLRGNPDIVCDARYLESLEASQFDAIYCSHNLEHYYRHDGRRVVRGFFHVLKSDGFAEIRVPDIQAVIQRVAEAQLDLEDILYESASGPIAVQDVIYGLQKEIESSGRDYYAHKTGFTPKLLYATLREAGFAEVQVFFEPEAFEARALAFKSVATRVHRKMLELS